MTTPARKFTYLVGFAAPNGRVGNITLDFTAPVTSQDVALLADMVDSRAPGAVVLGFSLFAPDREPGQPAGVPVSSRDFAKVVAVLREAGQRIASLEEEVKTLRDEAGLNP